MIPGQIGGKVTLQAELPKYQQLTFLPKQNIHKIMIILGATRADNNSCKTRNIYVCQSFSVEHRSRKRQQYF